MAVGDVLTILISLGAAGGTCCTVASKSIGAEADQLQDVSNRLRELGRAYEEIFVLALKDSAACMKEFAGFFESLGSQLDNVERKLDKMDPERNIPLNDKELLALYKLIQSQSVKLRSECDRYVACSTEVKIQIRPLERFEKDNDWDHIREWYSSCLSEKKDKESAKKLMQCVFPGKRILALPQKSRFR